MKKGVIIAGILVACGVIAMMTFSPIDNDELAFNRYQEDNYNFMTKQDFAKQYEITKQKQGEVDRGKVDESGNSVKSAELSETPGLPQGLWSNSNGGTVTPEEFVEATRLAYGNGAQAWIDTFGLSMETTGSSLISAVYDPLKDKFGEVGLIHYYQSAAQWGHFRTRPVTAGSTADMTNSACGYTGLSIIFSSLTHRYITPTEVIAARDNYKFRHDGDTVNGTLYAPNPNTGAMVQSSPDVCKLVQDLKYNGKSLFNCNIVNTPLDKAECDATLDAGGMVLWVARGSVGYGKYWTNSGHYVVLRAKDSDGNYYTADGSHDVGPEKDPKHLGNTDIPHPWEEIHNSTNPNYGHHITPGPGYEEYIASLGTMSSDSSSSSVGGGKDLAGGKIILPTSDKYYSYLFKDGSSTPEQSAIKYETEASDKKGVTIFVDAGHGEGGSIDYRSKTERTIPLPDSHKIWIKKGQEDEGPQVGIGSGVEAKEPEDEFTLEVALLVRDLLLDEGYDVVLNRDQNTRYSSNGGAARLATYTSDIMVSIHWNGHQDPNDGRPTYNSDGSINVPTSANGTLIFYLGNNASSSSGYDYSSIVQDLGISTSTFNNTKRLADIMADTVSSVGFASGETREEVYRILTYSEIPTVLVETGFGNNVSDRQILDTKRPEIAQAIVDGINKYYSN